MLENTLFQIITALSLIPDNKVLILQCPACILGSLAIFGLSPSVFLDSQAKSRKAIGVNLTPSAIAVLRRRLGEDRQYVFIYKGHPVTQVSGKAWWKALQRAGIENFRWHDLRHTWASWHIQAGMPLFKLQEMGGMGKHGDGTEVCAPCAGASRH